MIESEGCAHEGDESVGTRLRVYSPKEGLGPLGMVYEEKWERRFFLNKRSGTRAKVGELWFAAARFATPLGALLPHWVRLLS